MLSRVDHRAAPADDPRPAESDRSVATTKGAQNLDHSSATVSGTMATRSRHEQFAMNLLLGDASGDKGRAEDLSEGCVIVIGKVVLLFRICCKV